MQQHPTTLEQKENFERWKAAMEQFSRFENVYMKLSGAFSEMGKQQVENPMPVVEIVRRVKPWVDVLIKYFTPQRIMFGSDWPVCNVGGPGNALSWKLWKDAVAVMIEEYGLCSDEADRIWFGTAIEAYRLDAITR
jgi:L-rhamnono-1,4-lactonase